MQEELNENVAETEIWQQYQNGLAYQQQMGFAKKIPEFVRFFEGNQWATPTKKTKNLPRPVLNIIKFICRNKKSAIQATPVKLVYKADNETVDADKFTRFVDYIQKEMGQSNLDSQALDDGIKKGFYSYHYYWDTEAKGKDGIKEGALRCDVIDILDIFFANPLEIDEQKQEWIIISSRESVKAIREKADKGIDLNLIQPDECELKYGEKEQDGSELCTILTKYFRQNGEVYCIKATKGTIVNKAFPLTPNLIEAQKQVGLVEEDAPNNNLPDNDEDVLNVTTKFELYPIVVGNYELREKSIYGLGEIEGLIPNQKAINFNYAMSLLNAEELAWGKWKVLPDALKGQSITNEPGQVLIDHSRSGNGITRLEAQQFNVAPLSITDKLIENTRAMTGATEVMSGEVLGANMSGSAIAYLQAQSQQPIDELKNRYWEAKKKQGKVIEQFAKLFYTFDKSFSYENIQQVKDNVTGQMVDKKEQVSDVFNGEGYQTTEFTVVCEATTGTKSSTSGDINVLDVLLAKGFISVKTYIKAYPEDALSNKTELLKMIEADEQREINSLKQQNVQYAEQLTEMTKMVEQQKQVVDSAVSAIREMNSLKSTIVSLYSEASGKINAQNEMIKQKDAKIAETTADATYFAETIAKGLKSNNSSKGL